MREDLENVIELDETLFPVMYSRPSNLIQFAPPLSPGWVKADVSVILIPTGQAKFLIAKQFGSIQW